MDLVHSLVALQNICFYGNGTVETWGWLVRIYVGVGHCMERTWG